MGVSRSAITSQDTGTRLPSRARRSNSWVPGSTANIFSTKLLLFAPFFPRGRAQLEPSSPGGLEQIVQAPSVLDLGLEPRQLFAEGAQRVPDRLPVEPADLRPERDRAPGHPRGAEKRRTGHRTGLDGRAHQRRGHQIREVAD